MAAAALAALSSGPLRDDLRRALRLLLKAGVQTPLRGNQDFALYFENSPASIFDSDCDVLVDGLLASLSNLLADPRFQTTMAALPAGFHMAFLTALEELGKEAAPQPANRDRICLVILKALVPLLGDLFSLIDSE